MFTTKRTTVGFSLIEVIIVISAMLIITNAVVLVVIKIYKNNRYATEYIRAIQEAQLSVNTMVDDIREATYSNNGSYPLVDFNPNSITIYSDTNRDKNIERVRFAVENTAGSVILRKYVIKPTTNGSGQIEYNPSNEVSIILTPHLVNPASEEIFTYYDYNGNEIPASGASKGKISDIVRVKITVMVNVTPEYAPKNEVIQSNATIRNIIRQFK